MRRSAPHSGFSINSGGTLLFGSSNNQAGSAVPVSLGGTGAGSTGTINTAGFNETLGALTLNSSSTIDFGAGRTTPSSALHFGDSSGATWAAGTTLTISDYSGLVYNNNAGATSGTAGDMLFFGTTSGGLTGTQLAEIQFVNPAGYTGTFGAYIDGSGEVYAGCPRTSDRSRWRASCRRAGLESTPPVAGLLQARPAAMHKLSDGPSLRARP